MRLNQTKRWLFLIMLCSILGYSAWQGFSQNKPVTGLVKLAESKVAIVQSSRQKAEEIAEGDIETMVQEAVDLAGGFSGLIKDNQVVVIKPNLVTMRDYTLPYWQGVKLVPEVNGNATDWRITKAIVKLVRQYNPHGKVYVMEGSSQPTKTVMAHLKYTPEYIPGVDEFIAIEEDSGAWRDFESPGIVKVSLPNGLIHQEYYLNKKYKEADVTISVPCLKNHWHAAVSGAVKNVGIGATPANIYGISAGEVGRNNMVNHDSLDLHKWIHDFYLCRPVDFVIMDGLQGIQNGPTPCYEVSGTSDIKQDQMNMRLILAGKDAVAVDAIEALLMNWDPLSVSYLRYLNKSKAGNLDTAWIRVIGKPVHELRKDFEGVIPPSGGKKVKDKTAPILKIEDVQIEHGKVLLKLSVAKETKKVEVYIDGIFCEPVITSGYENIVLDAGVLKAGKQVIEVRAYDRFLNCSRERVEVGK
jgi:uncharacterized protein (DUF362 family)